MSVTPAATNGRRSRRSLTLLAASLLLLIQGTDTAAAAKQTLAPFDCSNVAVSSKQSFDLSKIAYPIRTSNQESTPPSETKTSIDIDLCKPLEADSNRDEKDQCPRGTRICITIETIKDDKTIVTQAIPVAYSGESGGSKIEAKVEWGEELEGGEKSIELQFPGATYAGREQKAELELVCDTKAEADSHPTARSYDRADGKLKLRWPTEFACSSAASKPGSGSPSKGGSDSDGGNDNDSSGATSSGGWGFFSWLFFLLFVGFAAYMGVGMYSNYNNYGASGWDLVPHKDFWRESPYIARDAATHVWRTMSGNRGGGGGFGGAGGRGAYEPI